MHRNMSGDLSTTQNDAENDFNQDLCQALIDISIPLHVVNNTTFRSFLEKYTHNDVPNESWLKTFDLRKLYTQKLNQIRDELANGHIWISVDETIDVTGRCIANIIVGKLDIEAVTRPYLLASKELLNVDCFAITKCVSEAIDLLGFKNEQILLFVTNGISYMLEAATQLKSRYPDMLHVTCFSNGFNILAEAIKYAFPKVNDFISCVQALFSKAPHRVAYYRKVLNIELPPEPVVHKSSTWIKTIVFYADNFEEIKKVIQSFDPEDSQSISQAQKLLENDKLFYDFIFIKSNFEKLSLIMEKLESTQMSLKESFKLFYEAENIIRDISGDLGEVLCNKLGLVLERNADLNALMSANNILSYNQVPDGDMGIIKLKNIIKYKFAPMSCFDAERIFPAYNWIISDNKPTSKMSEIEMLLICSCNIW